MSDEDDKKTEFTLKQNGVEVHHTVVTLPPAQTPEQEPEVIAKRINDALALAGQLPAAKVDDDGDLVIEHADPDGASEDELSALVSTIGQLLGADVEAIEPEEAGGAEVIDLTAAVEAGEFPLCINGRFLMDSARTTCIDLASVHMLERDESSLVVTLGDDWGKRMEIDDLTDEKFVQICSLWAAASMLEEE